MTQSEVEEQERLLRVSDVSDVSVLVHALPPLMVDSVVISGGAPGTTTPSTTQCEEDGHERARGCAIVPQAPDMAVVVQLVPPFVLTRN